MFNHLCMIDGEMVLYNSLTGSKGIRKVRKEDVEIVSEILGKKEIPDSDLTMFHKLIEFGFVVDKDFDETLIERDSKYKALPIML